MLCRSGLCALVPLPLIPEKALWNACSPPRIHGLCLLKGPSGAGLIETFCGVSRATYGFSIGPTNNQWTVTYSLQVPSYMLIVLAG